MDNGHDCRLRLRHFCVTKNYSLENQQTLSLVYQNLFIMTTANPMKVLLCGCGNAVHVLISYIGQQGPNKFEVNVLSSHADRLASSLPKDGCIRCINDLGDDTLGQANKISSDPAEVVPGCQVILFALPTDRHEHYLKQMLPFLKPGIMIGSMPGESGFDLCVRNILGAELASQMVLFSLETLPWACRIETFGQVIQVLGTKSEIDLCVFPGYHLLMIKQLLQDMIGSKPIVQGSNSSNFLGVSLMNPNAIAHPCIEYGLLRNWDGQIPFEKPPLFYQGLDDFTADTMDQVSHEILQVKDVIQKSYDIDLSLVRSISDFFEEAYAEDIADHSSLRNMFVSNKGYDGLTMPCTKIKNGYLPLFEHRYFTEDLPCGIIVQKGIAELAGVPTPVMDKVIYWCQDKIGKEYLVNGKLNGKDIATTKTPQRYGFQDLKTFLQDNGYITV